MAEVTLDIENPQALLQTPQGQQIAQVAQGVVNTATQNGSSLDVEVNTNAATPGGIDPNTLQILDRMDAQKQSMNQVPAPSDPILNQPDNPQATTSGQNPKETNPQADDKGVLDTIGSIFSSVDDAAHQAVRGVIDAGVQAGELVAGAAKFAYDVATEGWDKAKFKEVNLPEGIRNKIVGDAPTSIAGEITHAIGQWGAGFVMAGGLGNMAKIGSATTKIGQYAQTLGKGAVVDTVFFDRQEDRLSDLINNHCPSLANPVTKYLAANKDDSTPEAMLKMAIEGAGLGIATDVLIKSLKLLKLGKRFTKHPTEENANAYNQAQEDLANPNSTRSVDNEGNPARPNESNAGSDAASARQTTDSTDTAATKPADNPDTKMEGESPNASGEPRATTEGEASATGGEAGNRSARSVAEEIDYRLKNEMPMNGKVDGVNLTHHIFANEDGKHTLGIIGSMIAKRTILAHEGKETFKTIIANATKDVRDMGLGDILDKARQVAKSARDIESTTLQVQAVAHTLSDMASELATKVHMGTATHQELAQFYFIGKNLQEFTLAGKNLSTVRGRLLNMGKIDVTDDLAKNIFDGDIFNGKWLNTKDMTEEGFQKFMKEEGLDPNYFNELAKSIKLAEVEGGKTAVVRTLQKVDNTFSFKQALTEWRVNGMLSGPTTHLVNFGGSLTNVAVIKPLERFIGSALTLDKEGLKSSYYYMKGMMESRKEVFRYAMTALRLGDSVLDNTGVASRLESHQSKAITYERIRNSLLKGKPEGTELSGPMEGFARFMSYVGTVTRIPSRLLQAEDEICKQLAFRGQMYADIAEEASRKGLPEGKTLKEFIAEKMKDAVDSNGHVIENDFTAKALKAARDGTWTTPLESGTFGAWAQGGLNKFWPMKLVVPFFKTPMNLLYDATKHLNPMVLKKEWEAIKAGGEARADILGRLATGYTLVGMSLMASMEGRVTGGFPTKKKEAELWRANGIQPYSIRIGDTWVEYRRFDPLAMILSATADAYAKVAYDNADGNGNEDNVFAPVWNVLHGVAVAVSGNLMDKTYLQGVSDSIKAMDDMDRYGARYAGGLATSFMPYSGAARWVKNTFTDPAQHEIKSWMDYVKNSGPYFSEDLPTKHDWITGKPIMYQGAVLRDAVNDDVKAEMARLGTSVMGAPARSIQGVKLDSAQYARYCELHGSLKYKGKTMSQWLDNIINDPRYDKKRERIGDGLDGQPTMRTEKLNKIINKFREAAQHKMMEEFPEIREQLKTNKYEKVASKRGKLTAPQDSRDRTLKLLGRFGQM